MESGETYALEHPNVLKMVPPGEEKKEEIKTSQEREKAQDENVTDADVTSLSNGGEEEDWVERFALEDPKDPETFDPLSQLPMKNPRKEGTK